jgi:hypothetical protein
VTLWQLLGLLLITVLPVIAVWRVLRELGVQEVLRRRGAITRGTVVKVEQQATGYGATYTSTIRFQDGEGIEHEFTKPGNDGEGDEVLIAYDPEDPSVARVTLRSGAKETRWILNWIIVWVGSIVIWLGGWLLYTGVIPAD